MGNSRKIRMEEYNYNDENCNNSSITQSSSEDSNNTSTSSPGKRRTRRRGNRRPNRPLQVRPLQPVPQPVQYHHPQQHSLLKVPSKKVHDAPMKRRDMYFAIDCEMVGIGPGGIESALARVSIVNFEREIVLDTYVRVDDPVTDYRTFVSGIRPEHIASDSAMPLRKVQFLVSKILHGKILVGHGLENDLKVIGIQHPWCDIRDTATYTPFMRTIEKENAEKIRCPKRLRDLVFEKFGKEIQVAGKAHCPVEDAVAAMDLYKAVRNEWEMHMREEVNRASQRSLSPLQDTREPIEPLRPRNVGNRVAIDPAAGVHQRPLYYQHQHKPSPSADPGSQLLFQSQPSRSMPQFVSPIEAITQPHQTHQPYMNMTTSPHGAHYDYHMNPLRSVSRRSRVADARRAKELAKAKVVAALHQQRLMWQQKKQQELNNGIKSHSNNQRPVYVEQRVSV